MLCYARCIFTERVIDRQTERQTERQKGSCIQSSAIELFWLKWATREIILDIRAVVNSKATILKLIEYYSLFYPASQGKLKELTLQISRGLLLGYGCWVCWSEEEKVSDLLRFLVRCHFATVFHSQPQFRRAKPWTSYDCAWFESLNSYSSGETKCRKLK